MISLFRSNRKNTKSERVLWWTVGLLSIFPLLAVLLENPTGLFTDFRMGFFAFFAGIAIAGLLLNWGPLIPCSILGMAIFAFLGPKQASSYEEAVFQDLGIPLFGTVFGAMIGLFSDWSVSHPQIADESANGESGESTR